MDFSSFLTSLGTSFIIFVVLMLLFTWLSTKPGNHVVYFPSRILRGADSLEVPRRSRSPVAWIREALAATEADIVAVAGTDTAVYLVFLSSGCKGNGEESPTLHCSMPFKNFPLPAYFYVFNCLNLLKFGF